MVTRRNSAEGGDETAGTTTPISQLGYEACRDELIEVVRLLEQGGLDLDASLKLWERGEQLAKRCEEHLAGARKRVADALASGQAEED
ncbi:MAG TPA: exodeoxyribonuclease VII small subunit [Mycobacterium sp.]|nr:exodeoxyribonuclease VII small subunit [Mycobacterium sp.]